MVLTFSDRTLYESAPFPSWPDASLSATCRTSWWRSFGETCRTWSTPFPCCDRTLLAPIGAYEETIWLAFQRFHLSPLKEEVG